MHSDNPAAKLEAHYRQQCLPVLSNPDNRTTYNPALQVAAVGFSRCEGDWLGVIITPWSLDLALLPGGGQLWGDIPAGQTRYLSLPSGTTLPFHATELPDIGPLQTSPLISPVTTLKDQHAAQNLAQQALQALGLLPVPASDTQPAPSPPEAVSRRAFLRRLTGR